jgi:hypothetical protein
MSSVSIIVIEKSGNVKELKVKNLVESDIYKKAGFKTPNDFKEHTVWKNIKVNSSVYNIHVYGKTVGRANQENKYEFPPPIDNVLFFGSCVLINKAGDTPKNLTANEWKNIYNQLYGGFEDLDKEDSDEEDEYDELAKTKSGYAKDGFIVDDDDESYEDDSEELSDVTPPKKNKRKVPTKSTKRSTKPTTVFDLQESEDDSEYTNELQEEEYL